MPNELEALLSRIDDEALRDELSGRIGRLRDRRELGLVFEERRRECVRLARHPIRPGTCVARRDTPGARELGRVEAIGAGRAVVIAGDERQTHALSDLVAVVELGVPAYPGLRRLGRVTRGDGERAHVVIKGENHHALDLLAFTHAGGVDCIYVDPPYNTGARDWKYDNDFVDGDDAYRHSKWLSFMARRLRLAKRLLKSDHSVLIVTIDEKEVHRLGLLLEQTFPDCRMQMVSILINPKGAHRDREFARTNEFAFFVFLGDASVPASTAGGQPTEVRWPYLRRSERSSFRSARPNQFYAIHVDVESERIVGLGPPLAPDDPLDRDPAPPGSVAVFPIAEDGTHMMWSLTSPTLRRAVEGGFVRVTRARNAHQAYTISYLTEPAQKKIASGRYEVVGERSDGSKIVVNPRGKAAHWTTAWNDKAHDAGKYGTSMLEALIPGRRFPFPKSLYAVEDCLRIAVGEKPDAVIVDFFAGSGTTAHAVMRLNHQDGGRRQAIVVTNNEVSADEASELVRNGHRCGDAGWEALGIFELVTRPRLTAAATGRTPDGAPVAGSYQHGDPFPMSEGFAQNLEFLELEVLDPEEVARGRAFAELAPVLWLGAGARGPMLDEPVRPYESYLGAFGPPR